MFPSYIVRPSNCAFEGQDPDEKILLLLRAHPVTNIPWIVFASILILVPFLASRLFPFLGINVDLIPNNFQLILLIINFLLILVVVFEGFLNWYFNATVITNEKIVNIDFEYLLYKAVDLAPLPKVEETDSVTAGIMGSLFDFGNVSVQTAGATIAIEMRDIPHSAQVADMILDLVGKPHEHIIPPEGS